VAKDPTGNERFRRWYAIHREQVKVDRKAEYQTRKANGQCPRCGLPAKPNYTLCEACLARARIWNAR
jgi:hypothetical protein